MSLAATCLRSRAAHDFVQNGALTQRRLWDGRLGEKLVHAVGGSPVERLGTAGLPSLSGLPVEEPRVPLLGIVAPGMCRSEELPPGSQLVHEIERQTVLVDRDGLTQVSQPPDDLGAYRELGQ